MFLIVYLKFIRQLQEKKIFTFELVFLSKVTRRANRSRVSNGLVVNTLLFEVFLKSFGVMRKLIG